MRRLVLGALATAGLAVAAVAAQEFPGGGIAQQPEPQYRVGLGDQMIVVPGPCGEKGQLLTVVDPRQRTMAVYRVHGGDGQIELCSVRNIHWDLQMLYHNCQKPLPQEIRSALR